ncbi:MAG: branched-chain amino acid ABC transporter permease [Firmicutes bacterium]|nr:branched-chain amino acid ABC transporter permease [Bacillota bacterium]
MNRSRLRFVVGGVLLLALPFLLSGRGYLVYLVDLAGVYVVLTLGLNILTGYAGQISIGHAAFMAIGAYTSALLTLKLGAPFWLAMPVAGLIAAAVGGFLGITALRLSGHYLAIATLGFGVAISQLAAAWEPVTGGFQGLKPPKPSLFGILFNNEIKYYYLELAVVVLLVWLAVNLLRTRAGRAFMATRDSEIAAQAMGISLPEFKTAAFATSAFYAGVAGSLYGHLVGFISPFDFNLSVSLMLLAAIVVGGLGSIEGSVFGGIFITLLPQLFSRVKNLPSVLTGVVLILVVLFLPSGLADLVRRVKLRIIARAGTGAGPGAGVAAGTSAGAGGEGLDVSAGD